MRLTDDEKIRLQGLEGRWREYFAPSIQALDEWDAQVRAEIAQNPLAYAWYSGPGGGLPIDWKDSELARCRPHDWTQVRRIRFIPVTSRRLLAPRRPRPGGRSRRPASRPRTGSASRTSGSDPGDPEPGEPRRPGADVLEIGPGTVALIGVPRRAVTREVAR